MYTYPYEKKRIDEGVLADPRITIEAQTLQGFLSFKFLVDSGADVTTLPLDPYGELFGFHPHKNTVTTIGGIEGKGVQAYPHRLVFRIRKHSFTVRCYFVKSRVDPLLGRLDVWDKFSIIFDNQRQRTIFTPV